MALPAVPGSTIAVTPKGRQVSGLTQNSLAPGAFADVAIFKWKEAKAYFEDAKSTYRETDRLLVPQMTIADGKIVYCQVDFNNGL